MIRPAARLIQKDHLKKTLKTIFNLDEREKNKIIYITECLYTNMIGKLSGVKILDILNSNSFHAYKNDDWLSTPHDISYKILIPLVKKRSQFKEFYDLDIEILATEVILHSVRAMIDHETTGHKKNDDTRTANEAHTL